MGTSPFMLACSLEGGDHQPVDSERHVQRLEFLLREGCNILDNDFNGSTCLHVFFGGIVLPPSIESRKDSLIYLIRQGADPYALDYFGRSVSYIAYSKTCWGREDSLGTYRGDLFDAVLDCCGYDVSEFRKGYSWKRRYDTNYSRRDFELLWEGREYRYSNWSDAEWPITSQNSHKNVEGNRQTFICTCYSNCGFNNDTDDNDSEQEDKEVEVDYNDDIDDDGYDDTDDDDDDSGQEDKEVEVNYNDTIDDDIYNDNIEDDDSDDCEIQDPDSQALHRSYENDLDTAETQPFFPTTNHNYRELHPIENDYSIQSGIPERTYQHNQGQESHGLPSSVWQLEDQYDMDWTSSSMDASVLQGFPQYQCDDQQYGELFHGSWGN